MTNCVSLAIKHLALHPTVVPPLTSFLTSHHVTSSPPSILCSLCHLSLFFPSFSLSLSKIFLFFTCLVIREQSLTCHGLLACSAGMSCGVRCQRCHRVCCQEKATAALEMKGWGGIRVCVVGCMICHLSRRPCGSAASPRRPHSPGR